MKKGPSTAYAILRPLTAYAASRFDLVTYVKCKMAVSANFFEILSPFLMGIKKKILHILEEIINKKGKSMKLKF